jgi:hypothetical protein
MSSYVLPLVMDRENDKVDRSREVTVPPSARTETVLSGGWLAKLNSDDYLKVKWRLRLWLITQWERKS